MKFCFLIQLLASFAAIRIDAFSYGKIHSLKPHHVRFGKRMTSHHHPGNHSDEREDTSRHDVDGNVSRRSLLHSIGLSVAGTVTSGPLAALGRLVYADACDNDGLMGANAANAMGLVQFPCHPGELLNTYHMMRAGESGLEAEGILSTNPLFLTNREDALTDLGTAQVEEACNGMMSRGINPSVVKYSLASKCMDAANIVATTMMVGRNRIVPEFTFMDPRGAGLWDGKALASTEAAMWALDVNEAKNDGCDGRPPANEDGTANETLFEQVTRLRQLISVLETQYSGDCILLIFPDGTSPALLSCLIAGIPLKDVHALNFVPGELREGVNMQNAQELLKERISSPSYTKTIAMGQQELQNLRKEEENVQLLAMEESKNALQSNPLKAVESTPAEQNNMQKHRHRARRDDGVSAFSAKKDGGVTGSGSDVFSIGAVGMMGSMTMWRPKRDDQDESDTSSVKSPAPVLAYANSAGAAPVLAYANSVGPAPALAYANSTETSVIFDQPVITAPSLSVPKTNFLLSANTVQLTNVVDSASGIMDPNVFQDVPVISQQARIYAAEKAMDEYLSKDEDDDWLSSMQDIMDE